jgi:hypothetical protein
MKKAKLVIPFFAIVASTIAAWSSKPKQSCTMEPQYYFSGGMYHPAGVLGTDYICAGGNGICTYIPAGKSYITCQSGVYTPLHIQSYKRE